MRNIYRWITRSTPTNIKAYRTIKDCRNSTHPTCGIYRISFRFQTVFVAVLNDKILSNDGNDVPCIFKSLIVQGKIVRICGDPDYLAAMNQIGVDYEGCFTEIGHAWMGAICEDIRSKFQYEELQEGF